MRVLFLSTSYPKDAGDWRGIFMRHLLYAMAQLDGVELRVWAPPGELPLHASNIAAPDEARWLTQLMADGGIAHRMRSGGVGALLRPMQLLRLLRRAYQRERNIDLYHINWLQTALPLPDNQTPALITVLGNDLKMLQLPLVTPLLRRVMRRRRVVLCPNAEWLVEPLKTAFGNLARIHPVLLGIDPTWFQVVRRLDAANPCWLAVTRLTREKLGPLFEWSAPLFADGRRRLHLFGPMQERIDVPAWIHYHGAATAEQLAGEWFGRAHGLITLSQHAEGRPQVMLEAMAAGLPIIASDMPAHTGLVQHGVTGCLCRDPTGYAAALAQLEDFAANQRFGEAGRAWVSREVGTWADCARRYAEQYQCLLATENA